VVVRPAPEHDVEAHTPRPEPEAPLLIDLPGLGLPQVLHDRLEVRLELLADLARAPRRAPVDSHRLSVLTLVPLREGPTELIADLLDVRRDHDERGGVRGDGRGVTREAEGERNAQDDPEEHEDNHAGALHSASVAARRS
jgi:hypothetical protein